MVFFQGIAAMIDPAVICGIMFGCMEALLQKVEVIFVRQGQQARQKYKKYGWDVLLTDDDGAAESHTCFVP